MENNKYEVYGVHFVPAFSECPSCSDPLSIRPSTMPEEHCNDEQVLAKAFVNMQESIEPCYPPDKALHRGTLFKKLDLPWEGVLYCDD